MSILFEILYTYYNNKNKKLYVNPHHTSYSLSYSPTTLLHRCFVSLLTLKWNLSIETSQVMKAITAENEKATFNTRVCLHPNTFSLPHYWSVLPCVLYSDRQSVRQRVDKFLQRKYADVQNYFFCVRLNNLNFII